MGFIIRNGNEYGGATLVEELQDNLTAADNTPFRFGVNENGEYGYIIKDEAGADTVIPFKHGGNNNIVRTLSATCSMYGGGDYANHITTATTKSHTFCQDKTIKARLVYQNIYYDGGCSISNIGIYLNGIKISSEYNSPEIEIEVKAGDTIHATATFKTGSDTGVNHWFYCFIDLIWTESVTEITVYKNGVVNQSIFDKIKFYGMEEGKLNNTTGLYTLGTNTCEGLYFNLYDLGYSDVIIQVTGVSGTTGVEFVCGTSDATLPTLATTGSNAIRMNVGAGGVVRSDASIVSPEYPVFGFSTYHNTTKFAKTFRIDEITLRK